jgi:hypothetical protein
MSDSNGHVESDRDEEEEPLPAELLVLTSPELDHDEATARRAAGLIHSVHRSAVDGFCELELMERALGEAESASTRAQEARAEIRRAIAGFDEAIGGTSDAHDALIFHWKSDTPPASGHGACA